jgi:hypothetical protein
LKLPKARDNNQLLFIGNFPRRSKGLFSRVYNFVSKQMHAQSPTVLILVLFAVVTGRIDNLVDLVYDRFKNRYFPNERLIVDISGDK